MRIVVCLFWLLIRGIYAFCFEKWTIDGNWPVKGSSHSWYPVGQHDWFSCSISLFASWLLERSGLHYICVGRCFGSRELLSNVRVFIWVRSHPFNGKDNQEGNFLSTSFLQKNGFSPSCRYYSCLCHLAWRYLDLVCHLRLVHPAGL